jgi:hypothetical protein
LTISQMDRRHRALTPPIAGSYEEAASVCLSRHHQPPILLIVSDNGGSVSMEINWGAPDTRTKDAWDNERVATENGAYCCVIAGVEELRGLLAVRRAETGTGADYYVGPPGSGVDDLEDCWRLEISGTNKGDSKEVNRRVLVKIKQARNGISPLPAIAGVVGFAERLMVLQDVLETP